MKVHRSEMGEQFGLQFRMKETEIFVGLKMGFSLVERRDLQSLQTKHREMSQDEVKMSM